eukprot:gene2075-2352_t
MNVVVISKDTDVLLLMLHAFAKIKPNGKWFMKIDQEKYVNIEKIVTHFGTELATKLPHHIHAVTGCGATPNPYGVGKVSVLRKCIKDRRAISLLDAIGQGKEITEMARKKEKRCEAHSNYVLQWKRGRITYGNTSSPVHKKEDQIFAKHACRSRLYEAKCETYSPSNLLLVEISGFND